MEVPRASKCWSFNGLQHVSLTVLGNDETPLNKNRGTYSPLVRSPSQNSPLQRPKSGHRLLFHTDDLVRGPRNKDLLFFDASLPGVGSIEDLSELFQRSGICFDGKEIDESCLNNVPTSQDDVRVPANLINRVSDSKLIDEQRDVG